MTVMDSAGLSQQLTRLNPKGPDQSLQGIEIDVAFALLDVADLIAVQFGNGGQVFLRPTALRPQLPDIVGKLTSKKSWVFAHSLHYGGPLNPGLHHL